MSMSADEFLDNYGGERHPAVKFTAVGDVITGVIAEKPRVVETKNMNTQQPENKLVIALVVGEGSKADGGQPLPVGDTFAVWIKAGFAANAVKEATAEAGAGLDIGGKFTMGLIELRNTGKPQPAKVFKAKYEPPAPAAIGAADIDNLLS